MGELPWQEQQNELDVQLLAEAPYDDIYVYYLLAMIDFYNREPENYNNSYMMFNEKYNDFAKWWQRTHTPQKSGGFNTMGFGA